MYIAAQSSQKLSEPPRRNQKQPLGGQKQPEAARSSQQQPKAAESLMDHRHREHNNT